ncbi:unnamed protein product [Linum tenue]|uniref:Uncharacterized protein n=1 Tax=Linum tenue TaxID=586396 RepID=A0AAV0GS91_9ROSI|nr:unnamed protein product [Linum tenue]
MLQISDQLRRLHRRHREFLQAHAGWVHVLSSLRRDLLPPAHRPQLRRPFDHRLYRYKPIITARSISICSLVSSNHSMACSGVFGSSFRATVLRREPDGIREGGEFCGGGGDGGGFRRACEQRDRIYGDQCFVGSSIGVV